MEPTREIYWNISGYYFLYALFLISIVLFAMGFYKRLQIWRKGLEDPRSDAIFDRLTGMVKQVFRHSRLVRYPMAGVFHALLFSGFFILFIGTVVVFLDADFGFEIMRGNFYLYFQSFFLDIAGMAALVGVVIAIVNRYLLHPDRYDGSSANPIILISLAVILISGFLVEGARISATNDPWGSYSPIGLWVSGIYNNVSVGGKEAAHRVLWWFHLVAVLSLFAYLPNTKLMHALIGPANIFFRNRRRGALKPARYGVADFEDLESCGIGQFEDFTWKHMLDFDSCTECGRCTDNCPANAAGRPLSPKMLTIKLRDYGYQKAPLIPASKSEGEGEGVSMVGDIVSMEEIWSCTTCGACEEECPVFVEYIDKMVDMRRHIIETSQNPSGFNKVLMHFETTGNPFGKPPEKRVEWLSGIEDVPVKILDEGDEVDVLFYVDSYGAYEPKAQSATAAIAKGFNKAGVDFGILGELENDTGHQVRRIGEEGLFQFLVEQNLETLNSVRFNRIVTTDPHAFNTLKKDYPGELAVQHYTEYFAELLSDGKLQPSATLPPGSVYTYHDSCYLGRHNGIYEAPRQLLRSIPGLKLVEMEKHADRSFCCGGGDIILWHEIEQETERPAGLRIQMARAAGADVIVTACPFCFIHFEDAIKTAGLEADIKVVDLMELFISSI